MDMLVSMISGAEKNGYKYYLLYHMKKLFLVANWKSNLGRSETVTWFETIAQSNTDLASHPEKIVIICPPFLLLPRAKQSLQEKELPIALGAQNISPFGEGAYTGEVNAKEVKEYADYTIIGHSERRQLFAESNELLEKKVALALENGLTPIFCVQGKDTPVPAGVTIVAYEPITAIGTGTPDTPENADGVAAALRLANPQVVAVLYGGSVKPDNVATFTAKEHIDGVLVGGASLKAEIFSQLIANT